MHDSVDDSPIKAVLLRPRYLAPSFLDFGPKQLNNVVLLKKAHRWASVASRWHAPTIAQKSPGEWRRGSSPYNAWRAWHAFSGVCVLGTRFRNAFDSIKFRLAGRSSASALTERSDGAARPCEWGQGRRYIRLGPVCESTDHGATRRWRLRRWKSGLPGSDDQLVREMLD